MSVLPVATDFMMAKMPLIGSERKTDSSKPKTSWDDEDEDEDDDED